MTRALSLGAVSLMALACSGPSAENAHTHGGHGHDHGKETHGGEDERASIAVTRWTATHELFVELDAPVAGQELAYHAHVTRLADNHAATSGTLSIRFEQDGFAVESHTNGEVARPGIFSSTALSPKTAGTYRLLFSYADGEEHAEWDAGDVQVGASEPVPQDGTDEGEIAFLKESQWQVPFKVMPARLESLTPVVESAGVVHPAPTDTTVVAAPVNGLVAWAETLPVVGRRVSRGERLATLIPAGVAKDWASHQAELATARIDRKLALADVERVEGLSTNELISTRRIAEAQATLARAEARVAASQRRLGALSSTTAGAIAIRAPSDGIVVAVDAEHGQAVAAGSPVVTVRAGSAVLIEARTHTRTRVDLTPVASVAVLRGDWNAPVDLKTVGATVLTEQLIFDPASLSAPVSVHVPVDVGLVPGDLVDLSIGVGTPEPTLAVPRAAVVEINGQDVIFIQKTGESFTRRRVELGTHDATHVEITSGVSPGEMVVVTGGFDVHVASLSGALESHRH